MELKSINLLIISFYIREQKLKFILVKEIVISNKLFMPLLVLMEIWYTCYQNVIAIHIVFYIFLNQL